MEKEMNISILINTLEGMAADAEDKGEDGFGIRLTLEDCRVIRKALNNMTNSYDYKERFKVEYDQLDIRYNKLCAMLNKHYEGTLDFTPTCPIHLLLEQLNVMRKYLGILEARAFIEGIELC